MEKVKNAAVVVVSFVRKFAYEAAIVALVEVGKHALQAVL